MKERQAKRFDQYNELLSHFVKSNQPHPSKEFLTARLLRCILRIFKCIRNNKLPDKTAIKIDPKSGLQNKYWCKLLKLYRKNQSQPPILSCGHGHAKSGMKTKFNSAFYKGFFSEALNRKALKILISLLYSDPDPQSLSEKFNFSCCLNSDHSVKCTEKWTNLQEFLTNDFLEYY